MLATHSGCCSLGFLTAWFLNHAAVANQLGLCVCCFSGQKTPVHVSACTVWLTCCNVFALMDTDCIDDATGTQDCFVL